MKLQVACEISDVGLRMNALGSLINPGILRLRNALEQINNGAVLDKQSGKVINDELRAIHTVIQYMQTSTLSTATSTNTNLNELMQEIWPIIIAILSTQKYKESISGMQTNVSSYIYIYCII